MSMKVPTSPSLRLFTLLTFVAMLYPAAPALGSGPQSFCERAHLAGALLGVCQAFCESLHCDVMTGQTSGGACQRLRAHYRNLSGGQEPPCLGPDSDGDGVVDAVDDCRLIYDPDQTDSDGDGVGDRCDNCPAVANPDQASRDGDALGDSCDNCPDTYNKSDEDLDNDGRFDVFEDSNHNGVLDGCSTDPVTGVTTCLEDLDRDGRLTPYDGCEGDEREDLNCNGLLDSETDGNFNGIVDPSEDTGIPCDIPALCPGGYEPGTRGNGKFDTEDRNGNGLLDDTPFPDWIDYNRNGIPDAGEFRAPRGPVARDSDQDGVGDICDNCPDVYNPGQEDRDGDGRGDACDAFDTPTISEFSVTKERRHVECAQSAALCCVDPPLCSCCCVPDVLQQLTVDLDLVTVTAKVQSLSGPASIQKVVLAFEDPSPSSTPQGEPLPPISLEMFDTGSNPIGFKTVDGTLVPVLSGDAAAGDGTYSRRFYFSTPADPGALACLDGTDRTQLGFLYTTYQSPNSLAPDSFRDYLFKGLAFGVQGDFNTTAGTQFPIQGTSGLSTTTSSPCGPPTGNGGCLPSSGGTP